MQNLELPHNPMEMKLSEIFDYADKNLWHARIIYGSTKLNCACAVGSVAFVLSNGKTTSPKKLKKTDPISYKRYKELQTEFRRKNHHIDLVIVNDIFYFSFKMLANRCRKLGL